MLTRSLRKSIMKIPALDETLSTGARRLKDSPYPMKIFTLPTATAQSGNVVASPSSAALPQQATEGLLNAENYF